MGWDNSNELLTYPFTKIAANGNGDLQRALGRSVTSHIQLVGDVNEHGANVGKIKVMARYKPFQNPTVNFASDTDRENARKSARYGMRAPTSLGSITWSNNAIVVPTYQYLKPVSGSNPLRAMDFIHNTSGSEMSGYSKKVVAPIALQVYEFKTNGAAIFVAFDNYAASVRGEQFNSATNLHVNDVLRNDAPSYKPALILWDTTSKDYRVVVWNATMETVLSQGYAMFGLMGATTATTASPAVDILSRTNHEFVIIACMSNRSVDAGKNYKVYTTLGSEMSLAFLEGADRVTATLGSAVSMNGVSGSMNTPTTTSIKTENNVHYYDVKLTGTIDTRNVSSWGSSSQQVSVEVTITLGGSVFGFDRNYNPVYSTGATITFTTSVSVSELTQNTNRVLFDSTSQNIIFGSLGSPSAASGRVVTMTAVITHPSLSSPVTMTPASGVTATLTF